MDSREDRMDRQGFLGEGREWNPGVAEEIAHEEGLFELGAWQWGVIDILRDYYEDHGTVPMLRMACQSARESVGCCLSQSFDGDPVKAMKVAGIPQPAGEVISHYRHPCCGPVSGR
jgi:tRNA 2-thiouridine synthesizing protein E